MADEADAGAALEATPAAGAVVPQGEGEGQKQETVENPADSLFSDADLGLEAAPEGGEKGEEGEVPPAEADDPDLEGLKPDAEVPEKPFEGKVGEYTLKLPPGVKADSPGMVEFTNVLKGADIKPEKAQGLFDAYMQSQKASYEKLANMDKEFREDLNRQWVKEIQSDPEIGGKNFKAASNYAYKVMRQLLTKEEIMQTTHKDGKMGMMQLLNEGNIKNVPIFMKLMSRMGKALSEASPVTSKGSNRKEDATDLATALFGDLNI